MSADRPHLRRLPRYGWAVEEEDGTLVAVRPDRGFEIVVPGTMLGTREAAHRLGVRPPNFVRDWASRPDFPKPVATLASGRVWPAAAVDAYAARRRDRPTAERMEQIARRLVWWQEPARTLARPLDFVARVMAGGSLDDIRDTEIAHGLASFSQAMDSAAPGVFDRRSWNYWLLVLGRDRLMPLPARRQA